MDKILIYSMLIWNFIVFNLYGIDKHKAQHNNQRISERALLCCAFFMGGIGAVLGMKIYRHKTKKLKFKLLIPLYVLCNIAAIYLSSQFWLAV